jgi:undecaprenyl-diphosphatase
MTLLQAILLGVLQGATEFLPVSSSGHLLLVPRLLKMTSPTLSTVAIVHEGTLLAILIYFRRDLWQILKGVWRGLRERRPLSNQDARLGWYIVVGSVPAAVAGLTLEASFERIFSTPIMAAVFLLGTALLLVIGERLMSGRKAIQEMGWVDAIYIGLFQMLALLPGISRSGSTITAGLWRGLDRAAAARYSFLLGVPAILGAGLLALLDLLSASIPGSQWVVLIASFSAAAISGYLCIHFLLSWLRQRNLYPFAIYCATFGGLYLLIAAG